MPLHAAAVERRCGRKIERDDEEVEDAAAAHCTMCGASQSSGEATGGHAAAHSSETRVRECGRDARGGGAQTTRQAVSRRLHQSIAAHRSRLAQLNIITRIASINDPILSRVYDFVNRGWPDQCLSKDLKPSHLRSTKLTNEDNVLLWGLLFES